MGMTEEQQALQAEEIVYRAASYDRTVNVRKGSDAENLRTALIPVTAVGS